MGSWPWATVLGLLVGDLGAVNEGLQWAVGVGDSLFLSSGGLKDWVCRSQVPAKSQPTKATSHKCLVRRISGPPQPTPAPPRGSWGSRVTALEMEVLPGEG